MKRLLFSCFALATLLTACGQDSSSDKKLTAAPTAMAPMPGARPFKRDAPPVPDKEAFSKSMAEADARAAKP